LVDNKYSGIGECYRDGAFPVKVDWSGVEANRLTLVAPVILLSD
jgi:hypothetical protein